MIRKEVLQGTPYYYNGKLKHTHWDKLNEKECREILLKHGILKNDIEKEFSEAKSDHSIICPMFENFLYTFVLCIDWKRRKKYSLIQKAKF